MIALLPKHYLLLILFTISTITVQSQQLVDISAEVSLDKNTFDYLNLNALETEVFSYIHFEIGLDAVHVEQDHAHLEALSLLDIISSDEGADFNCSGGFCMNKSHFHKKGLTLKKQFFGYFMSIAC